MKKENAFILIVAISAAFLVSLIVPAMAYPKQPNGQDNSCVCDHWSESEYPGYYDEFTATGLIGTYASPANHYSSVQVSCFQAAYGGYYPFNGPQPTYCYAYYGATPNPVNPNYNNLVEYTYDNYASPNYPENIDGYAYHARDYYYTFTSPSNLNITFAQTQQWFYDQNFGTPWLCGAKWAEVYVS